MSAVPYSKFLSGRTRRRKRAPLELPPVVLMKGAPASTSSSSASSSSPPTEAASSSSSAVPVKAPPMPRADLTPIWRQALFVAMNYQRKLFAESREQFYQKNPRVPRQPAMHELCPSSDMVMHYMSQKYPDRIIDWN